MRVKIRGENSLPPTFPKLVKSSGSWTHYQFHAKDKSPEQVQKQIQRKTRQIKYKLMQLHQNLYPVIDHIHDFALKWETKKRGVPKFTELVFVAYGYTIGIENKGYIQIKFKKLDSILSSLGLTMSQRPVQYGNKKVNEIIIATYNNISIACKLVQEFREQGRLKPDVDYGSGFIFIDNTQEI